MKPKDCVFFDHVDSKGYLSDDYKLFFMPYSEERIDPEHVKRCCELSYSVIDTDIVCLELCSGNGHWLIEKALKYPNIHWIAVEKKWSCVKKILSKMHNHNVTNITIFCTDAQLIYESIPKAYIHDVFINFPDPWPKAKHAKHRIVGDALLQHLPTFLKDHGRLVFATDDSDNAQRTRDRIQESGEFTDVSTHSYFNDIHKRYGDSTFRDLWLSHGKEIHYVIHQKQTHKGELNEPLYI